MENKSDIPEFQVEVPANSDHGDFSCNVAMKAAKIFRKNPVAIAQDIMEGLDHPLFEKCEAVPPGFINIFISKEFYHSVLRDVLQGDEAFKSGIGQGEKVLVEFVSANPTGPLHVGHGRGAAYGDSLSRVLSAAGYEVSTEYYINDAGNQMNNLGLSIYARYMEKCGKEYPFPEDGYKGDYIYDIAQEMYDEDGGALAEQPEDEAVAKCLDKGLNDIRQDIEDDLKRFNVTFDRWFSEKSLYTENEVDACIDELREKEFVYDDEGAVWFKSMHFGDDKDRVLKKQNGDYTYFASDIAYHRNKFQRGFKSAIDVWGADHHGYVKRLVSSTKALGYDDCETEVVLIQMVSLLKGGEKVSMSTRGGQFVTLEWLQDEVGTDAARFIYMTRAQDAQFEFDIDLAKSRSNDNPVYYVQYAHARVCSIFRKLEEEGIKFELGANLDKLENEGDLELIKKINEITTIIEQSARNLEPHRITYYLQELAGMYHSYYFKNPIINREDPELTNARISISEAVRRAIRFGLELVGVNAPERM